MALQIEEQETHVNFMRGDARASIYTSDTTMMTKFNKLVEINGVDWKVEEVARLPRTGEVIGITYSCPVSFVSYRRKAIVREYTPEQRKQIADRLHGMDSVSRSCSSLLDSGEYELTGGEDTAEDDSV